VVNFSCICVLGMSYPGVSSWDKSC